MLPDQEHMPEQLCTAVQGHVTVLAVWQAHLWKLMAYEVISDNDDAVASWAQVLSRTGVNDTILADVNWSGQQAGRHVCHKHPGGPYIWLCVECHP